MSAFWIVMIVLGSIAALFVHLTMSLLVSRQYYAWLDKNTTVVFDGSAKTIGFMIGLFIWPLWMLARTGMWLLNTSERRAARSKLDARERELKIRQAELDAQSSAAQIIKLERENAEAARAEQDRFDERMKDL